MTRSTSTNFTGGNSFPKANAATDPFHKEDIQSLASAVDGHDHTTGKGLAISGTSPLTTKGDLYVYGTGNTRLAVGSNTQVLTADSTQATGLKWAAAGGGGSTGYGPGLVQINPAMPRSGHTNWNTVSATGAATITNYFLLSSGAQNAYVEWNVWLDAGTYSFDWWMDQSTNRGILTLKVDGTGVGTQDLYAGSPAANFLFTISGVSITAGQRVIRLAMDTKNASSSAYYGVLQWGQIRRTA